MENKIKLGKKTIEVMPVTELKIKELIEVSEDEFLTFSGKIYQYNNKLITQYQDKWYSHTQGEVLPSQNFSFESKLTDLYNWAIETNKGFTEQLFMLNNKIDLLTAELKRLQEQQNEIAEYVDNKLNSPQEIKKS